MYVVIWEFQVSPHHLGEFERHYAGNGAWAQLFRRDPAYKETRLLRDQESPGRYVTVDVWRDEASYHAFKERESGAYKQLDAECEAFTQSEKLIGAFQVVD